MTKHIPKVDIDPKDVKMVNIDDVEGDREAITLDTNQEVNVANIDTLSGHIIILLQYMNQPELKKLRRTDQEAFEQNIEQKYPGFVNNYYSIFKMLVSGGDITHLISMMRTLDQVNKGGTTFENARDNVSKRINDQYVNPKLQKNKRCKR